MIVFNTFSCFFASPVWYRTMALRQENVQMLWVALYHYSSHWKIQKKFISIPFSFLYVSSVRRVEERRAASGRWKTYGSLRLSLDGRTPLQRINLLRRDSDQRPIRRHGSSLRRRVPPPCHPSQSVAISTWNWDMIWNSRLPIDEINIILGVYDLLSDDQPSLQLKSIVSAVIHPKFVSKTFNNDIAILKLNSPVKFSYAVGPVCLPQFRKDYLLTSPLPVKYQQQQQQQQKYSFHQWKCNQCNQCNQSFHQDIDWRHNSSMIIHHRILIRCCIPFFLFFFRFSFTAVLLVC